MLAATVLTSTLALAANLVLFWREILSAAAFGIGAELDTFVVASLLPIFLSGLFANALAPALIPALARCRQVDGPYAARAMLTSAHIGLLGVAVLLIVILWALAKLLLSGLCPNCDVDRLAKATSLFRLLVPLIAVQLSAAVWRAGLGLEGRLVAAAITPIIPPSLGVLLLLSPVRSLGADVLAWSLLIGSTVEWGVLTFLAHDTHAGVRQRRQHSSMSDIARSYGTLLLASACTTSAWLVDNAMAAKLVTGSVAALSFGAKVVTFIVGIASIAVSQAVMPVAVGLAAHERWQELAKVTWRYGLTLALAGFSVGLIIVLGSEPITSIIYERGAFDIDATRTVSAVQSALALQFPFHVLGLLFVRMLSVLEANRQVLFIAAGGALINFFLNLILIPHFGVVGIAAATSAMFAATCVAAGFCFATRLGSLVKVASQQGAA